MTLNDFKLLYQLATAGHFFLSTKIKTEQLVTSETDVEYSKDTLVSQREPASSTSF